MTPAAITKWFRYAVIETTATPPALLAVMNSRAYARSTAEMFRAFNGGKFVVRRVKIISQES